MQNTQLQPTAKQVVIVDPKTEDYNCLAGLVESAAFRWTITSTGASSLRLVNNHLDALWLLSTQLPDMPGLDLLEMLRAMAPELTVFVIDNKYNSQHERRALQLSAARYLCKPIMADWIAAWRGLIKKLPTRSPPSPRHLFKNSEADSFRPVRQQSPFQ